MMLSYSDFLNSISFQDHSLNSHQQQNVKSVMALSKKFSHDAGISFTNDRITDSCIVLESGHQPNFFPHSGVWKKAVLLNSIKNHLKEHQDNVIALFGFADQNISTAKLLYENHIPAVNKTGAEKIGIKLNDDQRWRCFNSIQKPNKEVWRKEIQRILSFYFSQTKLAHADNPEIREHIETIDEIAQTSYDRANNYAELNAIIFSKICKDCLDLDIGFFRYSDISTGNIFYDEIQDLVVNRGTYIQIYNQTIESQKLEIPKVSPDYLPLWYHCSCGGKVALSITTDSYEYSGICPICKTSHSFSLDKNNADRKSVV